MSETEIKSFQRLKVIKLFQRQWTRWKIFMSCNKPVK